MGLNQIFIRNDFGRLTNWIENRPVASLTSEYMPLQTPYTGDVIGEVPLSSSSDLKRAVESGKKAFHYWSHLNVKERSQVMFRMKSLMERDMEELKQLISLESGKTLSESQGDISKAIEVLEFGCSLQNKLAAPMMEVSDGIYCQVIKEPLGVVACITPRHGSYVDDTNCTYAWKHYDSQTVRAGSIKCHEACKSL
jgi:malonate-semialdehyde dehydrogenase (acetylating) / methylmalonate-semialdehyde dehydrogenase